MKRSNRVGRKATTIILAGAGVVLTSAVLLAAGSSPAPVSPPSPRPDDPPGPPAPDKPVSPVPDVPPLPPPPPPDEPPVVLPPPPPPVDDDPPFVPTPPPPPSSNATRYPGIELIDLRASAPASYVMRQRTLDEVTAVVLHQTGFGGWTRDNPNWAKVRAHFVARRDGSIQINFDPEKRMNVGSNHANKFCITIECEGNYRNSNGNFWMPDKFGKYYLADAPKLVTSLRQLIRDLKAFCPKLIAIFAHCQWEDGKTNCCGPDLWREVGEWAKAELGLKDGGPGWYYDNGTQRGVAIPPSWRGPILNA